MYFFNRQWYRLPVKNRFHGDCRVRANLSSLAVPSTGTTSALGCNFVPVGCVFLEGGLARESMLRAYDGGLPSFVLQGGLRWRPFAC